MPSGVVPHYHLCQLVRCLIIGLAFWCGASLSSVSADAVSHYRPCFLVWCLTVPVDVVPHYSPCHLVWCLTISHAFCCGALLSAMPVGVVPNYRPCLLVCCLSIGHAFWCGASLSAMPAGVLHHYSHAFWRGLPSILSLFRNEFDKLNNTRARMLDSIYHMILRLFRNLISAVKAS